MADQTEQLRLSFRDAMASLAAHVNIITTRGPGGTLGLTATAVCSITDTPPTVLVCINKNSKTNEAFQTNQRMCVNVLSAEQEDISRHFAGMAGSTMEERFAMDIWDYGPLEQPQLRGSCANLEGQIARQDECGTHFLYFLELSHITVRDAGGLVYFKRKFVTL